MEIESPQHISPIRRDVSNNVRGRKRRGLPHIDNGRKYIWNVCISKRERRKCWAIVNIHIPATTPVTKHIPISPLGKIHTKELLSRRRKKQEKSGGVWYYKFPNDSYLQYIQDFINKITPLAISLVPVHHLHILCLVTYTTDMQNTTPSLASFSRWMASSDVFYAYDQEWTSLLCLNIPSRPSLSSPCVPMCVVCVCVLSASLRRILGSKASKSKQWTDM